MPAYTGSNKLINLRHGLVYFESSEGLRCELAPTDGDASIGEVSAGAREAVVVRNRGDVIGMLEGDSEEVSFSISIKHAGAWSTSDQMTPLDAVLKTGTFANQDTIDPGGVVFTGIIRLEYARPGVGVQVCTLTNVRTKIAYAESKEGNTLSISGTAYGYTAGGVRVLPVAYTTV